MTTPDSSLPCWHCHKLLDRTNPELNFCVYCGKPVERWLSTIGDYLRRLHIDQKLPDASRLLLKVEFTESARSALIDFEAVLRKKTCLDLHGVDLVSRSFSFEYDAKAKNVVRAPLISFGDVVTENGRNEQEGMLNMAIGVVKALRNPLIHTPTNLHAFRAVSVVTLVGFLLERVEEGGSILDFPTTTMHPIRREDT